MITEEVRSDTMAKLAKAQVTFAAERALIACLDGHQIMESDNIGYYRSRLHCSCAAEWWAGSHEGDPSYDDMWDIHRAEVIAAFMADHPASTTGSSE